MRIDDVYIADSLEKALSFKHDHPDYRWICGGTDVVPALRDGSPVYQKLIDINQLRPSLDYIRQDGGVLRIGALTEHKKIALNEVVRTVFPALAKACGSVGSAQIRVRASLAGNLANASPAADSAPALLAAEAVIQYQTAQGKGSIPIAEFFLGPRRISLPADGLITEIAIPVPKDGWKGDYYKVGARAALTIAIASAAVLYSEETGYRAAFGSVGPTVLPGPETKKVLDEGRTDRKSISEAVRKDVRPIDDVRASAEYRRLVCSNLVWMAVQQ